MTDTTNEPTGTNDAPIQSEGMLVLPDGEVGKPYVVSLSRLAAGFYDPDGDPLTVDRIKVDGASVTDNGDGTITITPIQSNFAGTLNVEFFVNDDHYNSTMGTTTLTFTVVPDDGYNDSGDVIITEVPYDILTVDDGTTVGLAGGGFVAVTSDNNGLVAYILDETGQNTMRVVVAPSPHEGVDETYYSDYALTGTQDGGFILVAKRYDTTNDYTTPIVYSQLFDANGNPVGDEHKLDFDVEAGAGGGLIVTQRDDGSFIVSSTSTTAQGYRLDLNYLLEDGAISSVTSVDSYVPTTDRPTVVSLVDGTSVLITSFQAFTYIQRLDGLGNVIDSADPIFTNNVSSDSTAVRLADGSVIAAVTEIQRVGYTDYSAIGIIKISAGGSVQNEVPTIVYTASNPQSVYLSIRDVKIAAFDDGGYVLAWQQEVGFGEYDIYTQRFGSDGAANGGAQKVNDETQGFQYSPSVVALDDGSYVVTWLSSIGDDTRKLVEKVFSSETTGSVNHSPELTDTQAVLEHGTEDVAYHIAVADLLKGYTDADGDTLNVTNLHADHGKVDANADGSFTITPDANFNGALHLTYSVSDGKAETQAAATVRFDAVNDAPELTGTPTAFENGTANTAYTVTVDALLAGYTDVDGDTLSVSGLSADRGSVIDNGDGTFTITPATGFSGQLALSYSVVDGEGGSASAQAAIVFDPDPNAGNHAPELTGDQADLGRTWMNASYLVGADQLLEGFTDADGDTLSVEDLTADHGTVVDQGDGYYAVYPDLDYNGKLTLTYRVSDGRGGYADATESFVLDYRQVIHYGKSGAHADYEAYTHAVEIYAIGGRNNVEGTHYDDILHGGNGIDTLNGGAGHDELYGNSGNDRLIGGLGADLLVGGKGNDRYAVDDAGDVVMELAGEGRDIVYSSISYALPANVENLVLTGTADINATGNGLSNKLTGNSGANRLDGGAGVDLLIGGRGNDTYIVGETGDVVLETAGGGRDTVVSSVTWSLGAFLENLTLSGTSAINGTGNALNNVLIGNGADNVLTGGAGNDRLTGGDGADRFAFGLGSGGDIITDFSADEGDTIDLKAYQYGRTAPNLYQDGADTVIELRGGATITVQNVKSTDPDFLHHLVW